MIVGDLNADIENIPALKELLEDGWIDLGEKAYIYIYGISPRRSTPALLPQPAGAQGGTTC